MKYQFPAINHLDQVRKAVEGRPEFAIYERDFGYVCNYHVNYEDTFPPVETVDHAILRECRGIIFNRDGEVISRPFHKFFNVNERAETQGISLAGARIMDKLDGSMIRPIPIGYGLGYRLGTKAGITEIAMDAETFTADKPNYNRFIQGMIASEMTPIFEWTSPKNRIVVPYSEPQLTLIGVRSNFDGEYIRDLEYLTLGTNIPIVRVWDGNIAEHLPYWAEQDQPNMEGWVLQFDDGHMVKVKLPWYVKIHKAREAIVQEKYVVQRIIDETIDDVLAQLYGTPDYAKVKAFHEEFSFNLMAQAALTEEVIADYMADYPTKKDYALSPHAKGDTTINAIVFKRYDGKPVLDTMKEIIGKRANTQDAVDSLRWMWADARYTY
jgi:RNA ligase